MIMEDFNLQCGNHQNLNYHYPDVCNNVETSLETKSESKPDQGLTFAPETKINIFNQ